MENISACGSNAQRLLGQGIGENQVHTMENAQRLGRANNHRQAAQSDHIVFERRKSRRGHRLHIAIDRHPVDGRQCGHGIYGQLQHGQSKSTTATRQYEQHFD